MVFACFLLASNVQRWIRDVQKCSSVNQLCPEMSKLKSLVQLWISAENAKISESALNTQKYLNQRWKRLNIYESSTRVLLLLKTIKNFNSDSICLCKFFWSSIWFVCGATCAQLSYKGYFLLSNFEYSLDIASNLRRIGNITSEKIIWKDTKQKLIFVGTSSFSLHIATKNCMEIQLQIDNGWISGGFFSFLNRCWKVVLKIIHNKITLEIWKKMRRMKREKSFCVNATAFSIQIAEENVSTQLFVITSIISDNPTHWW